MKTSESVASPAKVIQVNRISGYVIGPCEKMPSPPPDPPDVLPWNKLSLTVIAPVSPCS